jgi:hypothetical protein
MELVNPCESAYPARLTVQQRTFMITERVRIVKQVVRNTGPTYLTSQILTAYKAILEPIWNYGIQLWGSASISNIEIMERFQRKVLRMITDAPWYAPNMVLRQDLQITLVKEEIHRFSTQYRDRLYTHSNNLTVHLTVPQATETTSANQISCILYCSILLH